MPSKYLKFLDCCGTIKCEELMVSELSIFKGINHGGENCLRFFFTLGGLVSPLGLWHVTLTTTTSWVLTASVAVTPEDSAFFLALLIPVTMLNFWALCSQKEEMVKKSPTSGALRSSSPRDTSLVSLWLLCSPGSIKPQASFLFCKTFFCSMDIVHIAMARIKSSP